MHLEKILNMLYSSSYLDKVELENNLDELCYLLKVRTISGDIQIERTPEKVEQTIPHWLNNWVIDNQNYLSSQVKK